jgi:recombination protein RecR
VAVADPIARLVRELARLPGIGEKTAQRLAFHVLEAGPEAARELAEALVAVVRDVRCCSSCQTLTEHDPCPICQDPGRDPKIICVVEGSPTCWRWSGPASSAAATTCCTARSRRSTGWAPPT